MRRIVIVGASLQATTLPARGREVVGGGPSAVTTREGIPSAAMTRGGGVEAIKTGGYGPLTAMMRAGSRLAVITGRRCPSPPASNPHQA